MSAPPQSAGRLASAHLARTTLRFVLAALLSWALGVATVLAVGEWLSLVHGIRDAADLGGGLVRWYAAVVLLLYLPLVLVARRLPERLAVAGGALMCAAVSVPMHFALLSVSWRGGGDAFAYNRPLAGSRRGATLPG